MARPFEGLTNETDWVAMREIVPAATATVRLRDGVLPEGSPHEVTVATVLPLAWPGLHRESGEVLVGIQSGNASGDTSRDIAASIQLAAAAEPGRAGDDPAGVDRRHPAPAGPHRRRRHFELTLHDGFDFWVADADLDADGKESLDHANASVIPTERLTSVASAFWCQIGDRAYVRWVLPFAEDDATNALARLHADGRSHLGEDQDPDRKDEDQDQSRAGCSAASGRAACSSPSGRSTPRRRPRSSRTPSPRCGSPSRRRRPVTESLTAAERGAKAGLTNRQVTLR